MERNQKLKMNDGSKYLIETTWRYFQYWTILPCSAFFSSGFL